MEDGEITGFRVGVRVSYYRGVNLGIVHDFRVTADGETFDKSQMTFTVKAGTFRFDVMEGRTDVRWEFGEVAWLTVKKPGGLAEGTHRIHVFEEIRIVNGMNIKPVMFTAEWEETMELGPDWVQPVSYTHLDVYKRQGLAWAPLMIIILGIGFTSKAVTIFIAGMVPCVLNSYAGIKQTKDVHMWVARTFGASRSQMLFKVAIPTALPYIKMCIRDRSSSGRGTEARIRMPAMEAFFRILV